MAYYLRDMGAEAPQVWRIDGGIAVRLGVSNPENFGGSYFRAQPGESVWQAMRRDTPWFGPSGRDTPFRKLTLDAGRHYPRIARPVMPTTSPKSFSPSFVSEGDALATAKAQAAALTANLSRICRTVHPSKATLNTYGHDIRELLILASTEVEAGLRGVLRANGFPKRQPNMNDYVALKPIMRLHEYEISFPSYPWLAPIRPFGRWKASNPTESLGWYAAYHGVKHNRELEFERATLANAFAAVTANAVVLIAQFGRQNGIGFPTELSSFFRVVRQPSWKLQDCYCGMLDEVGGPWLEYRHPALANPPKRSGR